jgi:PadR family transcriptional regulator PadR
MKPLDTYEKKLLKAWEEVYKKGQLTFWILIALKEGPKHMAAIKEFIATFTHGTIQADDQSVYRALRRYQTAEMLAFTTIPGEGGPDRKVYELTSIGMRVLDSFTDRNIVGIFYQPALEKLITNKSGE